MFRLFKRGLALIIAVATAFTVFSVSALAGTHTDNCPAIFISEVSPKSLVSVTATTHKYLSIEERFCAHGISLGLFSVYTTTSHNWDIIALGEHSGKMHVTTERCAECGMTRQGTYRCSGPPCALPFSLTLTE